jgi:hypothetical protein
LTNEPTQGARAQDAQTEDLQPKARAASDDKDDDGVEVSNPGSESQPSSAKPTESKFRKVKTQFVDTSIEEKPATPQPSTVGQEKSPEYLTREAKLSEPLKKIIQAPHIYDNSKGGSSEFTAAFAQAAKDGLKSKEDLLFIVENGSPAGKIYAAYLLKLIEPSTGTRILNGFKTEKTLVNNKSYTSQEHYTMGEVATDLLSSSPTIILKGR